VPVLAVEDFARVQLPGAADVAAAVNHHLRQGTR
jgi:hypothetical protein